MLESICLVCYTVGMEFLVSLIRQPAHLTPDQLIELEANCRHVDGPWWIFEGDTEAFSFPVREYAQGVTTGLHPDDIPPGQAIIRHAQEIFLLRSWPPTR
jgi:hypothetical protein